MVVLTIFSKKILINFNTLLDFKVSKLVLHINKCEIKFLVTYSLGRSIGGSLLFFVTSSIRFDFQDSLFTCHVPRQNVAIGTAYGDRQINKLLKNKSVNYT